VPKRVRQRREVLCQERRLHPGLHA
jgi:hypothetical protein